MAADDSLLIRDYLERALSKMKGCRLVGLATDGEEALSISRLLRPDVAILDISMPRKSGIEVLRELRKENYQFTIIMFTADASPELEQLCLQEGANYFLSKTDYRVLIDILLVLQESSTDTLSTD